MVFKQLVSKHWFGGRVLMPYEVYINNRRSHYGNDYLVRPKSTTAPADEPDEQYQLKSLLNIIADSGQVETYLLTKSEV